MKNYYNVMDNKVFIQYDNIVKNIEVLNKYQDKKIIAVVKNDAYNLGLEEVVKTLTSVGIDFFAVANIFEASRIKRINPNVQVLILNPLDYEDFKIAYAKGFHVILPNIETIKLYNEYLEELNNCNTNGNIYFHLKINIGMNRFGISLQNLNQLLNLLNKTMEVYSKIVGLMTHFPQADEKDLKEHNEQVEKFLEAYNILKEKFEFKYIHSENSATFLHKDTRLGFCNYARVGILLYGYKAMENSIKLYPTMFLKTKVASINKITKGQNLGYGSQRVAKDLTVGICPIGYGDGLIDQRKDYPVYVKGKKYNIVGNISMSHMYIEVDQNIQIGDEVEIYGENIRFDDMESITNSKMMSPLKRNLK